MMCAVSSYQQRRAADARSGRPFHPARLWEAAFEAPRLPPTLRSKGFFWVAARPQRIWQWSTAGEGVDALDPEPQQPEQRLLPAAKPMAGTLWVPASSCTSASGVLRQTSTTKSSPGEQ